MKVNLNLHTDKVNFKGYEAKTDDKGRKEHLFNYVYDEDNFDCYLEFYKAKLTDKKDFVVNHTPEINGVTGKPYFKMKPGANKVNPALFGFSEDVPFAYHFRLEGKNENDTRKYVKVDAGCVVDNSYEDYSRIYNIHAPGGSELNKGGSMLLTMVDFHNPLWVYDKDNSIIRNKNSEKSFNSVKTFSNKVGGTMAGLEKDIDDGKLNAYSRLITTPFQTGDRISGHGYWITNAMQMALPQGNINNYASVTRKLFRKGKNFVSDAALVNEGLMGVHFQKILKYGKNSQFADWFRIQGLKDSPLTLAAFSEKKHFIAHRIVNSKYDYIQDSNGKIKIKKNPKWNSKKPTYIQIYDNRLVDPKKLDSSKLIEEYDNTNTANLLDINNYNDTVIPYYFEVDDNAYQKNIERLNEYNSIAGKDNKILYGSPQAARFVTKFENFDADNRFECGFDTWDANPDIAKLNFAFSHTDTEDSLNLSPAERVERFQELTRKNVEVQDYAVTSGQYWTQLTRDIIKLDIVKQLQDVDMSNPDKIMKALNKSVHLGTLPESVSRNITKDMVVNVLNGTYLTDNTKNTDNYYRQIKGYMMNLPLDSIELGDDISGTFATSYLSKRASSPEYIGVSRYDLWMDEDPHLTPENEKLYKRMNEVYKEQMFDFALGVLNEVEENIEGENRLHDKYNNTTKFGKVVLPIVAKQIAKFAVIKALYPDARYECDSQTGEISYDYMKLKSISLKDIGIDASSEKDEAIQLIRKLEHGIPAITKADRSSLASAITKEIKHTDYKTFTLADVIIDKTNAGLDWRIDAAKDIADVESLRDNSTDFGKIWDSVTDFWKKYADGVYDINPNSYMVAEVTDEENLWGLHYDMGKFSRYEKSNIVSKFLRETGIPATADYKNFFTSTALLFAKSGEDAKSRTNNEVQNMVFNELLGGGFLRQGDIKSVLYAYNFVDNHDKPRILDTLATDMEMFYADLLDPNNWEKRQLAYKLINNRLLGNDKDFKNADGKDLPERINGESEQNYNDRVNKFITENQDFSLVSSKACARGLTLNFGFGKTISKLFPYNTDRARNKEILTAINKSIIDLVNGSYLGHNFEAEGFGVKPYNVCIDLVLNQAKTKYHLNLSKEEEKKLNDGTFETIMIPNLPKFQAMMKVLVGVPGIPTLFSGDDLGVTGYEQKTKNIYLQNRNVNHLDWVSEPEDNTKYKEFIDKHRVKIDEIMALRSRPEMHAMNDGTPYLLKKQRTKDISKSPVTALLRQAMDGSMVITMFNLNGAKTNGDEYLGFEKEYKPTPVEIDCLDFDIADAGTTGLAGGLKQGLKFVNAADPNDVYYTREKNGKHYLVRLTGEKGHEQDSSIVINDTTLNLYHVPNHDDNKLGNAEDSKNPNLAFTGRRVMYNPQYKFISKSSNPYQVKNMPAVGNSLKLTSK